MEVANEQSKLLKWEQAKYNWSTENARNPCTYRLNCAYALGLVPSAGTVGMCITLIAIRGICDEASTIANALAGTALGLSSLMLINGLYARNKYRILNIDPFTTDENLIRQEKFELDTQIYLSLIGIGINTIGLIVINGIC